MQTHSSQIDVNNTSIEIVWFKRDLRVVDHAPLFEACQAACQATQNTQAASTSEQSIAVLPIYIVEPEIWQGEQASLRHWRFIAQSLLELKSDLAKHGLELRVLQGSAVDVLQTLFNQFSVTQLHSHQETGNLISYQRDLKVQALCKQHQVAWRETPQQAVQRGQLDRDFYAAITQKFFNHQPLSAPDYVQPTTLPINQISNVNEVSEVKEVKELTNWQCNPYLELTETQTYFNEENTQQGGRQNGLVLLRSFIEHRHKKYLANISKPLGGDLFSSRLSAHLAYGTLSTREVMFHARTYGKHLGTEYRQIASNTARGLQVFQQRLFWQSHFIQKLETEPEIEKQCMHPAYEDIRPWNQQAQEYFAAWRLGKTGFPMIDAAMRCLNHTGWLPFRMRALLVSFASYQLWIPWQQTAQHLARMFTDFEPGIHFSQIQMQSGTTGINAIRIYNPIKQSQEHDANGAFIRRWCPELAKLDNQQIHTPWETDLINQQAVDYPSPIVDLVAATQRAKDKVYGIKKHAENKTLSQAVFIKHGSRNSPERRQVKPRKTAQKPSRKVATKTTHSENNQQMSLF